MMATRVMAAARAAGVTLGMLALCAMAQAQEKTPRIGVVDVDQVMNRSESFRATVQDAQKQIQPRQDELDKMAADLQKARQALRTRQSVMSKDEVEKENARIDQMSAKAEDMNYAINKDITRIQRELMDPQVKKLMETIRALATSEGYDLILRSEDILYFNDTVDITPRVIQTLDKGGARAAEKPAAAEEKPAEKIEEKAAEKATEKTAEKPAR